VRKFFRGKLFIFLTVICICLPHFQVNAAERVYEPDNDLVIVIDPGHGGDDPGTQGGRIQERFMNLITAQALAYRLNMYDGVTVYMTRSDNDTTLSLTERAVYAKSVNADFVFSIHYNACVMHDRFGMEVYTSRIAPYNGYGYQFGDLLMRRFEENYGIYPRGVKTRKGLRTEGDYYTIIAANIYRKIPAVIIEHCFADGNVDAVHTESDDQFRSYGETDADAIAEFFGLSSTSLGIDNSGASETLVSASTTEFNDMTYEDRTAPESVSISVISVNALENTVTLKIEGEESDGMMMFYEISTDGGWTWNDPKPWPDSDCFRGTYSGSFEVTLPFNTGDRPSIVVKGFNRYDAYTKSNKIVFMDKFDSRHLPLYRTDIK